MMAPTNNHMFHYVLFADQLLDLNVTKQPSTHQPGSVLQTNKDLVQQLIGKVYTMFE